MLRVLLPARACWRLAPARRHRSVASRPWRPASTGSDRAARHLLHAVRGCRPRWAGHAPRHGRDRRRHRLRHRRPGTREYGRPQLRAGALDGAVADVRVRLHRADRVVGGHHAGGQLVEVEVRGRNSKGVTSSWDLLGRWASGDKFVRRTTESPQSDDLGRGRRRHLEGPRQRRPGLLAAPASRSSARPAPPARPSPCLGAMASRLPARRVRATSPRPARGRHRARRAAYSQMVHSGHFPQWGGGGEAWCSPTSTSMVLGYYDALPPPSPTASCPPGHPAPWVDYAARRTYDAAYEGTGNWPFNTAYAAPLAGARLRHPAAVAARGRDVRRRRHPARRLGLLGRGRADRRPGLVHQRPPAGDRRLHRRRATSVVNDPAAKTAAGVRARLRPRRSSRTPGCRRPAAWSTSSTTPPTRCRPRPPRPTGSSAPPQRHTFWSLGRPLRMTSCARACERREETSRHYQRITHQGPCGKTLLVADNHRSCPPASGLELIA